MNNDLLPNVFKERLTIIFCGMAAGKLSARVGGYYADTNNKFWNILEKLKFTRKKIKSCNYKDILEYKLGLTDLVKNQSGTDNNVDSKENNIKLLEQKITKLKPKILAFNGKKPARLFLRKKNINYGEQKNEYSIGKTRIWVLPSTSGLNRWWSIKNHEKIWKNLYQLFIKYN